MSTTTLTLPVISAEGGLGRYLREIKKFPMVTAEEEYMLAKRFHEHGDLEAAHRLVTSHLRLVAKMAMGFRHYGLPVGDLIGEGNVGLMRAVKKFDPEKGFRLATYAMWWIKAALHEYVLASWSMVKIGSLAAHKKLFFNLRRLKAHLRIVESGEMTADQIGVIATELNVSEHEVVTMNRRMAGRDSSLNAPVAEDRTAEMQDYLVDEGENQEISLARRQEGSLRHRALAEGLGTLNARERHIIDARHLSETPATLEDLGKHYGVSRERIRQIETRAIAKLRAVAEAALA